MMNRRGFLAKVVAACAALLVGIKADLPAEAEEVIYVDWVRAWRLEPDKNAYAEVRFRMEGATEWTQRVYTLQKSHPTAWLTKRTGIDLSNLWDNRRPDNRS